MNTPASVRSFVAVFAASGFLALTVLLIGGSLAAEDDDVVAEEAADAVVPPAEEEGDEAATPEPDDVVVPPTPTPIPQPTVEPTPTAEPTTEPTPTHEGDTGLASTTLEVGITHSCAVRDAAVWCWENAALSNGPVEAGLIDGTDGAQALTVGPDSACVVLEESTRCWRLSAPSALDDFPAPSGMSRIRSAAVGASHVCVVDEDDHVACGALTDVIDGANRDAVTQLSAGVIAAISVGTSHACVLGDPDGVVRCWALADLQPESVPPQPPPLPIPAPTATPDPNLPPIDAEEVADDLSAYVFEVDPPKTEAVGLATGPNSVCAWRLDPGVTCWRLDRSASLDDSGRSEATSLSISATWACATFVNAPIGCVQEAGIQANESLAESSSTIDGTTGARLISVGDPYSCAVLSDDSVGCWINGWSSGTPTLVAVDLGEGQ